MKKYLTLAMASVVFPAVGILAGCSSTGSVDNPVVRRLSWFSFISGDDLRDACQVGETNIRLTNNANYREDVRVLAIHRDGQGQWQLDEDVMQAVNWANIVLDPNKLHLPWQPEKFSAKLTDEQADAVVQALTQDQAFVPLVGRVPLNSRSYFWTGAGCMNGQPWFHAWAYPSAAYANLTFPAVLEELQPSGRPFAPAQVEDDYPSDDRNYREFFVTYATAEGVAGRGGLSMPGFQ